MSESTKVTKKRKRESTIIDYFISGSTNKVSSSKSARENGETAKLDQLAANATSMIANPLKASLPSNLATVKEYEFAEEKNPVIFCFAIAFTQKGNKWMSVQPGRPAKARFIVKAQNAKIELCLSLWHEKAKRFTCRWSICQETMTASNIPLLWKASCVFPVFCLEVMR